MQDMFNEDVWPAHLADDDIDDLIWQEIKDSQSRGDFICYLIHRQRGRYLKEAQARLKVLETVDRTPVGYVRAVERIRALAEGGDARAYFHMGKLAVHGIGMPQDMQVGVDWYRKGADAGELRCACNLGWIYLYGFDPIPPNKEEAFRLLSMGAENGVGAAMASIGLIWLTGDGRPADPKLGVEWMEKSFASGYNNAGNHLADAYFAGRYLPHDVEMGHTWLERVAAAGDERTMAILGFYLVTGSHGKTDVARGLALLQESIDKDYVPAYLWIGNLYRNGMGVAQDWALAREWFERGVEAGNTGCEKALADMLETAQPPAGGSPMLH